MEEEQERTRIVRRRLSRPQQDRNAARRARRNEERGLRCNPFSASSRTIRAMTPLQLDRKLNHLRLDTLMVFSEDGVISLGADRTDRYDHAAIVEKACGQTGLSVGAAIVGADQLSVI